MDIITITIIHFYPEPSTFSQGHLASGTSLSSGDEIILDSSCRSCRRFDGAGGATWTSRI